MLLEPLLAVTGGHALLPVATTSLAELDLLLLLLVAPVPLPDSHDSLAVALCLALFAEENIFCGRVARRFGWELIRKASFLVNGLCGLRYLNKGLINFAEYIASWRWRRRALFCVSADDKNYGAIFVCCRNLYRKLERENGA